MTGKYKILFLGECNRADAVTWIKGLREFGPFEVFVWQLDHAGKGIKKLRRFVEMIARLKELKQKIVELKPDLIIAERITSYGFIAALFHKYAPLIIAQQGITDIYPPVSFTVPLKERIQKYAFKHSSLIHAWGEVMTHSMQKRGADSKKIVVLAKGVDLRIYQYTPEKKTDKLRAIITRSLTEDYRHETILKAFEIIRQQEIPFELTIIGDGHLKAQLIRSAVDKNIYNEVRFVGRIPNNQLPAYLSASELYISMPCTEGVSASLLEAMSSGCYPIVTDLPGNKAWITDGINGKLIKAGDAQQLATAIKWYLQNRLYLREILDENRKMIEEKASYEKNMQVICNKYLQIITGNSPQ